MKLPTRTNVQPTPTTPNPHSAAPEIAAVTHRQTRIRRAKPSSDVTAKANAETGRVTHRQTRIPRKKVAPTTNHEGVVTTTPTPTPTERMAVYSASLVVAADAFAAALDDASTSYAEAKDAARTAATAAFAAACAAFDSADRADWADARMADLADARILSS